MRVSLSKRETVLLVACLGVLAVAVFAPAVAQPTSYHAFADQRVFGGVPFAMDVLSNLSFALAGLAGMHFLRTTPPDALSSVQRAMSALFFAGLLLTAALSGWYHWQPDDAGLAVDRGGMAVAFAGLLGLAVAGPVSERAGVTLALAVGVLAPLSIWLWAATGNVLPWAALQSGGLLLLVWLAWLRPLHQGLEIRLGLIVLAYALAKLLELNDHSIYALSGGLVSGHTLKHGVAALAAVPVITGLRALRRSRQNAADGRGKLPDRRIGRA